VVVEDGGAGGAARRSRQGGDGSRHRLLLVRSDHLGDVLLTLPAAAVLRRALPDARITYLVASGLQDVPGRCPLVDDVIHLPFPPPERAERPADAARWAAVLARAAPRLEARFDVALLFRPADPWAGALVRAAAVPVRLGYREPATRGFLTDGTAHRPKAHAVAAAVELADLALARIGAEARPGRLAAGDEQLVVPTPADRHRAAALLARLRTVGARPYVLHPGTGWPLKLWPAERWGGLAASLARRFGCRPLVTGGPAERALVERVVAASGGQAVGVAGRLSLGSFAALLERAEVVVASDSGPLHLAAMVGAPVVGLYGPVAPAQAGPWCRPERHRLVWTDLPCWPCGTMEHPPCGARTGPACVTGTTVDQVLAAVEALATHGWHRSDDRTRPGHRGGGVQAGSRPA
jgi:ADP-heptose:LPS heptosyltransferase